MSPSNLSRRQFLVHSAGIAGASLGIKGARAARPEGDVRLGFIGLGERGRQLLGAALAIRGASVVALCDIHPERLKKGLDLARRVPPDGARSPRGVTDARVLIDAADVDAVFIATPVFRHRDETVRALEAGKHVYCEKPMARTAAECREVLAACREAAGRGQVYQPGLQRRFNPRYRRSIEFIHSGDAGPVRFVRAQWHAVSAGRKDKPWIHRRDRSGDIVLEQAIHQFDVLNWVFRAPPLRASAMGGSSSPADPPGRDVLDHYGAMLEFPGGGLAQLSHLTYSIPERRFSGIYELAFCAATGVDLANALTWEPDGRTRPLCAGRGNETQLAVEGFIDAAAGGPAPLVDAEDSYRAAVSALLCARAVETGRRVELAEIETL